MAARRDPVKRSLARATGRSAGKRHQKNVPLAGFLLTLLKNPAKLRAFRKNPEPILESANLTAEDKEALRSGDAERIKIQFSRAGADTEQPGDDLNE